MRTRHGGPRHRRHGGLDPTRLRRHWVRRRLEATDDVAALEAYQRDLEQEVADVAQRIRALKDSSSTPPSAPAP
jgi:hypothetical protein